MIHLFGSPLVPAPRPRHHLPHRETQNPHRRHPLHWRGIKYDQPPSTVGGGSRGDENPRQKQQSPMEHPWLLPVCAAAPL